MKRKDVLFLSLFVGMLFALACEQINMDDEFDTKQAEKQNESSGKINYDVSLKSARFLAESVDQDQEHRVKKVDPIVYAGDTLLYIVNFNKGWQVISGDKRTEAILASDSEGSLNADHLDHPGVTTWLGDLADRIYALKQANPEVPYDENIKRWILIDKAAHFTKENLDYYRAKYKAVAVGNNKSTPGGWDDGRRWVKRLISVSSRTMITNQVGPLLQTKWGQGAPWNSNVPSVRIGNDWVKCPTGCVAVAMSQIIYNMHYCINKPTGLFHDVLGTGRIYIRRNDVHFYRGNYVTNSNRWDLMPLRFQKRVVYNPELGRYIYDYTTPYSSYVADLMADVGNRVDMSYSAKISVARTSIAAFNRYGINASEADYDYNTVYNNLNNNKPVLVTADADKDRVGIWPFRQTVYKKGHAWVIDGYRQKETTSTYIYEWEFVGHIDDEYLERNNPYYKDPVGHEALSPSSIDDDIYHGKRVTETYTNTHNHLIMNWGWDGAYDNGEYATYSSAIWTAGEYDFQYRKRIFYDFR
ncbi:C10 family peptidase [Marinifilum caeruleilacunae]|uniref:Spi protease inhibitor domain-containing protein n=1 Tax=Marinifilum caeruleilacunae TaxID=2499076 RepID=A0ABX1WYH0_9BACT|nr:C10 family peptidase [Marinifilum caeruleilacunae]NOU60934.1 hypothetical protein [Marinifilum caeruleilacunae]